MKKNITIPFDEAILRKCRQAAVDEGKLLSQWIIDQIAEAISARERHQEARRRALERLEEGFDLGGVPLSRQKVYRRKRGES